MVIYILVMVRREQDQTGAFSFCLPDRFSCLYTELLRGHVFCENDPMPCIGASRHSNRNVGELRMIQKLHRRIKAIHITMKYDSVHDVMQQLLHAPILTCPR